LYNIHTKDNTNNNNNDNDNDNGSISKSSSSISKNIRIKHKNDEYKGVVLYDRYEELKSIDFILCKTEICYKFFNFIKNEQKNNKKDKRIYYYQTIIYIYVRMHMVF
jgi:hypothetical protein